MSEAVGTLIHPEPHTFLGAVSGQPRVWLGLEAAAMLSLAVAAYAMGRHSWMWFAILFFVPDVTFFGYLAGPRIGSVCYNIAHSYVTPVAIGAILHVLGKSLGIPLIWIAHIGFDRLLGYGLKYSSGFGDTHLGRMGRR